MGQAIEKHKDFLVAIQAIATTIALLVAGLWTYALTSQFRETEPKLAIKQDVSSWKLHDGSTLLRVDSTLTNTSKVRIAGVNGKMIIWRLLPETMEQAADYDGGKILFSCRDEHGKQIPECIPDQGLNLPQSSKKQFEIKDLTNNLEPGESVAYWRYLHFDGDVKTIEVYTVIEKPGRKWDFDSAYDLKHR